MDQRSSRPNACPISLASYVKPASVALECRPSVVKALCRRHPECRGLCSAVISDTFTPPPESARQSSRNQSTFKSRPRARPPAHLQCDRSNETRDLRYVIGFERSTRKTSASAMNEKTEGSDQSSLAAGRAQVDDRSSVDRERLGEKVILVARAIPFTGQRGDWRASGRSIGSI